MMWPHDDRHEAEQLTEFMRALAAVPLDTPPRADAAFLWWKAQLLRRWDAEQQAMAPLETGERVEAGVGIAAGVLLLVWLLRSWSHAVWTPAIAVPIAAGGILLMLAAALVIWTPGPRT